MKNYALEKKFIFTPLSTNDTMFYKGVAILMIVMHNFFHWLPPRFGENEQDFKVERFETYFQIILNQPELFLQATLSLAGHYGVQVFLFLSAYGLTKKYLNTEIIYFSFLKRRVLKIYPVFLLSIVFWAIYTGMAHEGPIQVIIDHWKSLVVKVLLIANFFPGQLYSLNGPWWFVSLIFQFYLVFPFMLYIHKKYNNIGLIGISLIGLLLTVFLQPLVNIPIPGTILTHLPELAIGIFLAKQKDFSINYLTIAAIVIIFMLSNLYYPFWLLSYSSALILLLISFKFIIQKSNPTVTKFILFVGSISMYVFYINGFMRTPWIGFAKSIDTWYMNIFLCTVFVVVVLATSFYMARFYNFTTQKISSYL